MTNLGFYNWPLFTNIENDHEPLKIRPQNLITNKDWGRNGPKLAAYEIFKKRVVDHFRVIANGGRYA